MVEVTDQYETTNGEYTGQVGTIVDIDTKYDRYPITVEFSNRKQEIFNKKELTKIKGEY